MPLVTYEPKRMTVTYGDGEGDNFSVRAISVPDLSILIEVHEDSINTIVQKVRDQQLNFNSGNDDTVTEALSAVLTDLIRESPVLIGNLIAICADERNAMEAAGQLPITIQMEALTKIAELTFKDLASIKKLAADVMRLVRGIVPNVNRASATK